MLFDDDFVISVKDEPVEGVLKIISTVHESFTPDLKEWDKKNHDFLFEAMSLLLSIFENLNIGTQHAFPVLEGSLDFDAIEMNSFLDKVKSEYQEKATEIRLKNMKNKFDNILTQNFIYEFSQGDLDRVQELVNELRDHITSSKLFEKKHKQRLLKRLEQIQKEIHKRVSDLDRLWGLIGDAGVAIGKFGNDAKPIVDRIKEITNIVWRTQSIAEELPSGMPTPLLKNDNE